MTKDDSYHKKRGKGFIFSPERQIYKTDELRYALEDLQKLHEDVMFIRDEEKTPTEKLEFLDNAYAWVVGFMSKAIEPLIRYTNFTDEDRDSMQEEFQKFSSIENAQRGSKKGQEFENAILSYDTSNQEKKEICDWVKFLVWGIMLNSQREVDGSRL